MKIRTGFVSNSSSSSFCGWALRLDYEDIMEVFNYIGDAEDFSNSGKIFIEELFKGKDPQDLILLFNDYESGQLIIGRSYTSLNDEETGKQFKDKTEEIIKTVFEGKDISLDFELIDEEIYE